MTSPLDPITHITTTTNAPTDPSDAPHQLPFTTGSPKAEPGQTSNTTHFRVRHDRIDKTGTVTLRHNSRLHHIGIGRAHKHTPVTLLVADLEIRVIATQTGELRCF